MSVVVAFLDGTSWLCAGRPQEYERSNGTCSGQMQSVPVAISVANTVCIDVLRLMPWPMPLIRLKWFCSAHLKSTKRYGSAPYAAKVF